MSLSSRGVKEMSVTHHVVFDCDGTLLNMEQGGVPFEGIPELLHRLTQLEVELYLWTARDRASLMRYLQAKNLLRYFKDIRTSGEAAPKPYPEALQSMLKGIDPSMCAMIGDSWADMRGAKTFGCHAIGALWDKSADRENLKEFGADVLVSTPSECYDALLRIFQG